MDSELELLASIDQKLSALIALTIGRESTNSKEWDRRPEIVLDSVGLPVEEIAEILGKNEPAVRKALQRARKAPKRAPES